MVRIISVHSFRGGTGKSNISANIATLAALEGKRVGIIDTDIQSPGLHVLFGLEGEKTALSLNDYLRGEAEISEIAIDVTDGLKVEGGISGKIFLLPSSIHPGEITQILRDGYDVRRLTHGLRTLIDKLDLDVLVIDTHPGISEETVLALAITHVLLVVMRPDYQDYESTGIAIRVAKRLDVPRMMLVVNKMPGTFSAEDIRVNVEQTYNCKVAAIIPHSDEIMTLASRGIFALHYPDHPVTDLYREIVARSLE